MRTEDDVAAEFVALLARLGFDVGALAEAIDAAAAADIAADYSPEMKQQFAALLRQSRAQRGRS